MAATLTDENFANALSKNLWAKLPEDIQAKLLVDFQCTDCLLRKALGVTQEEIEEMDEAQMEAALARATAVVSPEDTPKVALNNIRISYEMCHAPCNMEGKKTIVICGQCAQCGADIQRIFSGMEAQLYMSLFAMLTPGADKAKIGRNDLCPCGSQKKYKKCCGKGQ